MNLWLRSGIGNLLMLTLVVAIAASWLLDRYNLQQQNHRLNIHHEYLVRLHEKVAADFVTLQYQLDKRDEVIKQQQKVIVQMTAQLSFYENQFLSYDDTVWPYTEWKPSGISSKETFNGSSRSSEAEAGGKFPHNLQLKAEQGRVQERSGGAELRSGGSGTEDRSSGRAN